MNIAYKDYTPMLAISRILLCMSLSIPLLACAADRPEKPHVAVQGYAEIEVLPDSAELTLQLSATRESAAAAKADVDRRVAAVLSAARSQNITDEAIRASQIRVAPDYQWEDGKRQLKGQRVEREVVITLAELDRYGALVDALVKAGIDQLGNVRFLVSQREALAAQALKAAVADGRERAALLAAELGSTLDGVYSIDANATPIQPVADRGVMMMEAKAAAAPMLLGKETISARVSLVFTLD